MKLRHIKSKMIIDTGELFNTYKNDVAFYYHNINPHDIIADYNKKEMAELEQIKTDFFIVPYEFVKLNDYEAVQEPLFNKDELSYIYKVLRDTPQFMNLELLQKIKRLMINIYEKEFKL